MISVSGVLVGDKHERAIEWLKEVDGDLKSCKVSLKSCYKMKLSIL